jgi:hypothetical protein
MGFKYDWNAEIIAQFHATFFYDSFTDYIHWMTEGVHYKINFVTFARLLGFGKTDRDRDTINFENHLKNNQIADAYFLDEMAQGTTLGLKPVYYVLNNLLRQTIYPREAVTPHLLEALPQILLLECFLVLLLFLSASLFGMI